MAFRPGREDTPARPYSVKLRPSAARELAAIPQVDRRRIARRVDALVTEPRPAGVQKLAGADDLYRIRVGDYRVIYTIGDRILLVLVVRIGHRREVYRGR